MGLYRIDLEFDGVDDPQDTYRIGFWAEYVDNNGNRQEYWEENYHPSRSNVILVKSFVRGITIFQFNGLVTRLQPRTVYFSKLLPYPGEEPPVTMLFAEGLSDELTFTIQGFENHEVVPNQELAKQLKAYATLNPDLEELKATQGLLLAAAHLPDIATLFVYTLESMHNLRGHIMECSDKKNVRPAAFLGTILKGAWGIAKHAPMIAEVLHKIFGKKKPKALMSCETEQYVAADDSSLADIEKNPGPMAIATRIPAQRKVVIIPRPTYIPSANVDSYVSGRVATYAEDQFPSPVKVKSECQLDVGLIAQQVSELLAASFPSSAGLPWLVITDLVFHNKNRSTDFTLRVLRRESPANELLRITEVIRNAGDVRVYEAVGVYEAET